MAWEATGESRGTARCQVSSEVDDRPAGRQGKADKCRMQKDEAERVPVNIAQQP